MYFTTAKILVAKKNHSGGHVHVQGDAAEEVQPAVYPGLIVEGILWGGAVVVHYTQTIVHITPPKQPLLQTMAVKLKVHTGT